MELSELQITILEIVLSGANVLRRNYGFNEEQIDSWLDDTKKEVEARRLKLTAEIAGAISES